MQGKYPKANYFLYANDEQLDFEIKFTVVPKIEANPHQRCFFFH